MSKLVLQCAFCKKTITRSTSGMLVKAANRAGWQKGLLGQTREVGVVCPEHVDVLAK